MFPDLAGGLETVHTRHLAVHEYEVRVFARRNLDGLETVARREGFDSHLFQHLRDQDLAIFIIFDNQYPGGTRNLFRLLVGRLPDPVAIPRILTQPVGEFIVKRALLDRLGKIAVHPGLETEFPVAFHCIGGHRDNRHARTRIVHLDLAHEPRCLASPEPRHLDIHEDQVKLLFLEHIDSIDTILCLDHFETHLFEHAVGDLPVDLVVLDNENPAGERRHRTSRDGPYLLALLFRLLDNRAQRRPLWHAFRAGGSGIGVLPVGAEIAKYLLESIRLEWNH